MLPHSSNYLTLNINMLSQLNELKIYYSTSNSQYSKFFCYWPYYCPQRNWAKVIFLQACVCSQRWGRTWSGPGGCTWQTPPQTRYTTPNQVPPEQVHPPLDKVHPPWTRYTPRDQVHTPPDTDNKPPVCILLECILV